MTRILNSVIIFSIVTSTLPVATAQDRIRDFDTMGDVNCEDEYARLDSFALQLNNSPHATGVIIFYGGLRFRGRLPRRNESAARAARLKPYLVNRRGIAADRIIVINGGYKAEWQVELWVVPNGMPIPTPYSPFNATKIKFRKGKAHSRQFRCQI